jgi:predicted nucleotidyltransferase
MSTVSGEAYDRLVELLARDPRVRLVYAFGSAARDAVGPLSDVDVAALLDARPDWDAERELRGRLAAAVPGVDLVILNEAPPALRFEIVTGGRCLLARDPREQAEFEIVSLSRFLDFQPMRRVQQEYLRARVEERRGPAA